MSIQLRVRIAFALCGVALAVCVGTLTAQPTTAGESEKLLAEVKAAWEKRQEAVKTLRVSCSQKVTTPKGTLTSIVPPTLSEPKKPPTTFPTIDWVHDGTSDFALDGKKTRIVHKLPLWDFRRNELVSHEQESTCDGKLFTQFDTSQPGNPQAVIEKSKQNGNASDMMLVPILAAVRGGDSEMVSQDTFIGYYTSARRVTVGGRALIELTRPRNESRGESKMWVDTAQAFSFVTREGYDRDGRLTMRISVAQSSAREIGWFPDRWTCTMLQAGKLFKQVEVTVRTCEFNATIPDIDFQVNLRLPVGTLVHDASGSEPREYLTRAEGKHRAVLPSERFFTYDQLAKSETGELGPKSAGSVWRWLLIALGLVLGVCSLRVLMRRASQVRRTTPDSSTPTT